jgi:hypothetical protein
MSSFTCACGASYCDGAEDDASFVAYSLPALGAAESRIAEVVGAFLAADDATSRTDRLASYFGVGYHVPEGDPEIIQDIVSRELNREFLAMFRCPCCGRIALCDHAVRAWVFFRREPRQAEGEQDDRGDPTLPEVRKL